MLTEVIRFYDDHKIRPGFQEDREEYARWAIPRAIQDYNPNQFSVTGDILGPALSSAGLETSHNGSIKTQLMSTIQADGLKDNNAEASDHNCQR